MKLLTEKFLEKCLTTATLLLASTAASAQQQDWTYSDEVTGTVVTDSGSNPYSGAVTGTIVLNGSGAAETLTYDFTAAVPAGVYQLSGVETLALGNNAGNGQAANGWITPVLTNGAVTGFTTYGGLNDSLNDASIAYNGYYSTLSIVNGAATMQWLASVGDCSNNINCTVTAAGGPAVFVDPPVTSATSVPEISGAGTMVALTLLFGVIAVLKGSAKE